MFRNNILIKFSVSTEGIDRDNFDYLVYIALVAVACWENADTDKDASLEGKDSDVTSKIDSAPAALEHYSTRDVESQCYMAFDVESEHFPNMVVDWEHYSVLNVESELFPFPRYFSSKVDSKVPVSYKYRYHSHNNCSPCVH